MHEILSMQLPETISQVLNHIRDKIGLLYSDRFVSLQLYGSYARNEARQDSDIDLLLVLDGDVDRYSENWKLSDLVLDVLNRFGVFTSFVVLSQYEYRNADWPLLASIENETILL